METNQKNELFAIVREALKTRSAQSVENTIFDCHQGKFRDFVKTENLHLFRLYRNSVSGNPKKLIDDSIN